MNSTDYLMYVDVETFGFDPNHDAIIEVGLAKVDVKDFSIIDSIQTTVWNQDRQMHYERLRTSDWVYKTHDRNQLWNDCRDAYIEPHHAEAMLVEWLEQSIGEGDAPPMVGNSVHFDRGMLTAQMPSVASCFSHRNIDFSTLRELCERLNPELFSKMRGMLDPLEEHRVMSCIKDSIGQAQFFADNFLFTVDLT